MVIRDTLGYALYCIKLDAGSNEYTYLIQTHICTPCGNPEESARCHQTLSTQVLGGVWGRDYTPCGNPSCVF